MYFPELEFRRGCEYKTERDTVSQRASICGAAFQSFEEKIWGWYVLRRKLHVELFHAFHDKGFLDLSTTGLLDNRTLYEQCASLLEM